MDSSISNGISGNFSLQMSSYSKSDSSSSPNDVDSSLQPPPVTTIPQLHQTQEQSIQELQKAIEAIQGPQRTLEISVHDKTHAITIKVLNKETGDLIREIPPEKILDVVAKMMEFTGILVDKKV
ncbi:flagellar protein FlaG [Paenibacillus illinoisensis]|uniref:flagellar protein FlaG n=1 Tax=Paenibacillus illinoisensis TaxID=59845 RepID=UPI001C8D6465|nr:flagellar protein FlaG [Paenibacillus illinoisensis]MBY0220434.1 flagellar protein FlaG [Paenibacillus illinoisensis]